MLFLLVMGGVAVGFVMTERRQSEMDRRVRDINKEMRQASESLKQLEVLESKRQEMMSKASVSASLMEPVPRSLVLATLTNALPAGVSLEKVDLVSKKVGPSRSVSKASKSRNKKKSRSAKKKEKEAKDKEKLGPQGWQTEFEVSGLAQTDIQVSDLIGMLSVSPLFEQVNLLYSEEHEQEHEVLRFFSIQVVLDPSARASEEDVEMARKQRIRGM